MTRSRITRAMFALCALLAVSVFATSCGDDGDGADKPTIVFSDLNWTSAQVQNRIAQFIIENGYGYETDAILGGTLPNFQGLLNGDIHVDMEVWLPNQVEQWDPAVANGQVVPIGKSLGEDWQSAFVIPKYVADQNPGLTSVDQLASDEYKALFATTDSRGKARIVGCIVGWSCEVVNIAQIDAYGLNDHVEVISPGSQEALFSDSRGATTGRSRGSATCGGPPTPRWCSTSCAWKSLPTPMSAGSPPRPVATRTRRSSSPCTRAWSRVHRTWSTSFGTGASRSTSTRVSRST